MLARASLALGVRAPTLKLARCLTSEPYTLKDDEDRGMSSVVAFEARMDLGELESDIGWLAKLRGGKIDVLVRVCSTRSLVILGATEPCLIVLRRDMRGTAAADSSSDLEPSFPSSLDSESESSDSEAQKAFLVF
jgi:hypothetical protein